MAGPLVVAIINTSPDTVELLSVVFEHHGTIAVSGFTHAIRAGTLNLESFLHEHKPDVVVYDIAPPYERNWRFFEHLKLGALGDYPCVLTSTNAGMVKKMIVTDEPIYEILEKPYSLDALYAAVAEAAKESPNQR